MTGFCKHNNEKSTNYDMKRELILLVLMVLGLGTAWGQATPAHVAIGDILCDDGTTVRREDWPQSGKTPVGIVFYVEYRDGNWHGSAIGLGEAHHLRWANSGYDNTILGTTATKVVKEAVSDMDGAANTLHIVGEIGDNHLTESNYPALYYVTQLGDDWYLPAMGQLHYLYGYIDEINATVAKLNEVQADTATPFAAGDDFADGKWSYWPSTEYNEAYKMWFLYYNGDCADVASATNTTATPANKSDFKRVRAAKDF